MHVTGVFHSVLTVVKMHSKFFLFNIYVKWVSKIVID